MNEMLRTNIDQAAPTLRSAQVAAAHSVRSRPVAAIAVLEAPQRAVAMEAPVPAAISSTPAGPAAILSRMVRDVVASLRAPDARPGQASSRRSLFGLLGVACRSLGTDALLAAAAAARPR